MKTYLIIENEIVTNSIIADDEFVQNFEGTIIEYPLNESIRIGDSYINGEFISLKPPVPESILSSQFQKILLGMSLFDINEKMSDEQKEIMNELISHEYIKRDSQVSEILKSIYSIDDSIVDKIFRNASKL